MNAPRLPLTQTRRLVVKLGTRVLTHDDGRLARSRVDAVVEALVSARSQGLEVLLVSSGAVGLGREALGFDEPPTALADRQACAAVGQSRLVGLYQEAFERHGVLAAQLLLSQSDFDDRLRYLNLRTTLGALLRRGVVPVINENDAVSTEELAFVEGAERPVFGDNDRLSALVATKLDADLLLLLTDVEGVYDADPRSESGAQLLATVDPADCELLLQGLSGASGSDAGRGGMRSKVEAARIAAASGCHAVVASGRDPQVIGALLQGRAEGTWFTARAGLSARDRWIAWATAPRGTLHLDPGAVTALRSRGASLLAVGVQRVEGEFGRGDVVELVDPTGALVGRGIVHCDADSARRWVAGARPKGLRNHDALVHRDNLVLRPQTTP